MSNTASPGLAALAARMSGNNTDKASEHLKTLQTQSTQNGVATTNAIAAGAPTPTVFQESDGTVRAFRIEATGYQSYLAPSGTSFTFYQGFLKTSDPEIITEALKIKGCKEVPNTPEVPDLPQRQRGRRTPDGVVARYHAETGGDPTTISPMELISRSIANSSHVPQSAESSTSAPT